MKGYELIKAIEEGYIDDCKIKWKSPKGEGIIEVHKRKLEWEPGTFSTLTLTSSFAEFETVEKGIQKLRLDGYLTGEKINIIEKKINEIIEKFNEHTEEIPF